MSNFARVIDNLNFLSTTKLLIADLNKVINKTAKKIEPRLKDLLIDTHLVYRDSVERKIADSLHVKMWQKTDFNNDGQTDLLVYGHNGSALLLAVISDKDNYKIDYLTLSYSPPVYYPVIKKDVWETSLLLYSRRENEDTNIVNGDVVWHGAAPHKLSCLKLIYQYNSFIESNPNPVKHTIQNISYSTDGGFGTCPIYNLTINSKREAIYQPKMYCGDTGTFYLTIDTASYNQIIELLNATNFPALSDKYAVEWTDDDTCYLAVSYDNGKEKKIEDYGKQGTYGLSALYSELSKLRKTQKWKRIKQ